MFGRHSVTDRETRVLLCSDPSGQSAGFEVAVVAGRDGPVVVHQPTQPGTGPSVEGLDDVSRRAAEAAT